LRIISKFNDYYDSALAYGMDPGLVYRRETSVALSPESWDGHLRALIEFDEPIFYDPCVDYSVAPALVVVGNRAFRYWVRTEVRFSEETLGVDRRDSIVVDDREVAEIMLREALSHFGEWNMRSAKEKMPELVAKMKEPVTVPETWLLELGVPCFAAPAVSRYGPKCHPIVLNPRLATLGLEKRLDPYSCFQEIEMFIGQRFAHEDRAPRTVGDDRVIAASKGFDEQSFRTAAPGKKKENRRANRARKRQSEL